MSHVRCGNVTTAQELYDQFVERFDSPSIRDETLVDLWGEAKRLLSEFNGENIHPKEKHRAL
jgi:hypothetical protein